jgi:flagellar basal body-associated protein FliL
MDMNRKTGICIFIIVLAVFLVTAWLLYRRSSLQKEPAVETEEAATQEETMVVASTTEEPVYAYLLREQDGMLVVCLGDGETVYMETGIRASQLPDSLREELSDGIGFSDEESLFAFLENYAS